MNLGAPELMIVFLLVAAVAGAVIATIVALRLNQERTTDSTREPPPGP